MIDKDANGAADRFMAKLMSGGFTMDYEFPQELDKKCIEEEFHKMMTTINDSEIPIEKVNSLDYPD